MYAIGFDIGSSSIKASLVRIKDGVTIGVAKYPDEELTITAHQPGWAEQEPEMWWFCLCKATKLLLITNDISSSQIESIGISYQMHGLVLVDKNKNILRPSIIWCDSRAAAIGSKAFTELGESYCLSHYLNSPGNFTASKLKWVKDNEPELFEKTWKFMLPGDFIAMKLSGECNTTLSGLSEGIFWDFQSHKPAEKLLTHYGIPAEMVPDITQNFSVQGLVSSEASEQTGLPAGIPITYRAGDQPNNALSLNVLHPGEMAATGGTSGVMYGIADTLTFDPLSRVNGFAHVNHSKEQVRIGQLLCINGCGIVYSWLRKNAAFEGLSYLDIEEKMKAIPHGSEGLRMYPFGNGAERIFSDRLTGARFDNLQFNVHSQYHMSRAALEGIAYSFAYGYDILKNTGVAASVVRVGNDNLFLSPVFSQTLSNVLKCPIEMFDTTGAAGAAKASMVGTGHFKDVSEAIHNLKPVYLFSPDENQETYESSFREWKLHLESYLQTYS